MGKRQRGKEEQQVEIIGDKRKGEDEINIGYGKEERRKIVRI